MATVGTQLMTAEEFWAWWGEQDDEDCRFELDRGHVVKIPLAGRRHGLTCGNLCGVLWERAQRAGGYACSNNTALLVARNPDTVLCPDLMLFGPLPPGGKLSDSFCTRAPLLIAEVLDDDKWTALARRISQFLTHGVPEIWAVDPEARSVTVFRPGTNHAVLEGDDLLPDLSRSVADLFNLPGRISLKG